MPFAALQPPKDETAFATLGKEIVGAARGLGIKLDAEGFLLAWIGGTRVIVERDQLGTIVGLALVTIGKRWVQSDFTATVLEIVGSDQLLEFTKQICSAMGATSMFMESRKLSESPEKSTYEITQYHLT